LFEGRRGVVVAADLSQPEVAAAVADFCQRSVQLLAASLRTSAASGSGSGAAADEALVVHVVPLPAGGGPDTSFDTSRSSSSSSGSSSSSSSRSSSSSIRSGGDYELPPVLVRLNGTSGSPGSSASGHGGGSSGAGRVEVRLHRLGGGHLGARPHGRAPPRRSSSSSSTSSGSGGTSSSSGGSALLAAVLASARLHVVCTPVAWLRGGAMDLHVHEAMLAG
jgi:hypothetical protein